MTASDLTILPDPAPDAPASVVGSVAIETHGCKLNQADSIALARQFAAAGYRLADHPADADIIVVNTCTVTATADAKARQALRAAARANPDAVVVAAGCYPERAAAELRQLPEVTLVVGNTEKAELAARSIAARAEKGAPDRSTRAGGSASPGGILRRSRATLKIQEGCNQVCAYCIVPKVRGRERSIPPQTLLSQIRDNIAAGYREIVLTGTQLGSYGFDLDGIDLPGLLDRILAETEIRRLRVSSLQAHEISNDLLRRWQDARLCPHFHVPLQSGSDAVLRAMRRRYDTADFRNALARIRSAQPDAAVTTDVIAGFPGETAAQHRETVAFAAEMRFADGHIFPYSQRPGTSAHHYSGQVAASLKRARAAELSAIAQDSALEYRRQQLGQTRPVLWETARRDPADRSGSALVWSGLTDNYLRVTTTVAADRDLANRITPARLINVSGKTIRAELVAAGR